MLVGAARSVEETEGAQFAVRPTLPEKKCGFVKTWRNTNKKQQWVEPCVPAASDVVFRFYDFTDINFMAKPWLPRTDNGIMQRRKNKKQPKLTTIL